MPLVALVVDDEQSIRDLVEVTLQLEGYMTLAAADGPTAVELAKRFLPDVITLDIMMPGMTGWEVADQLARDPLTARIPIVVVSGKAMIDLDSSSSRHRASAVLAKPFDLATFVEVVAGAVAPTIRMPLQRQPASTPLHVDR